MARTITPRAREIMDNATKILADAGYDLKHVANIVNAFRITRSMDLEPNVQWHEADVDFSDILADAFDYVDDL